MIARWFARFAPMSLCALVGVLAFGVSPAGAAQTRRTLGTFGGASSSVVDPYPLSNPQGVAVDEETEDVYVADAGNHRVEKFSATGQFLLAFGGSVGGVGVNVCGGLVGCVAGVEGSATGDLTTPKFIAVDNDPSSPSFHDVYVADTGDNVVSKFSAEGALVESWGVNGQLNGFGSIAGIAVGSTGTLYVLNTDDHVFEFESGSKSLPGLLLFYEFGNSGAVGLGVNAAGALFKSPDNGFGSASELIEQWASAGNLIGYAWNSGDTASVALVAALTVAPSGDLYFATTSGALEHDSFNGAGEVMEASGGTCRITASANASCQTNVSDSIAMGFVASGIAVASGSGDVLLSNGGDSMVYRYGPLVTAIPPEEPLSEQAVEVKAASARLQGVLNASSEGEPGTYEFLYRQSATSCEGGKVTPAAPAAGMRGEVVSAVAGELLPGTVYTFCLRASNGAGETATGAPVSFTTGVATPGVEGLSASDVAASSATLDAGVDPGGGVTSCVFEYAPVGGVFVPVPGADGGGIVAEGDQSTPVSVHVQGLQAGTVYEFRVSVSNSVGSFLSEPVSFTTEVAGGGLVLPDGRQWELVSPADKRGALLDPIEDEGGVVQAAVDGDAMTFLASAPTEGEPPGYAENEQVLSVRGSDGWVSRDISLPHEYVATASVGAGREYVAFSEDLSQAVVQPHGAFEPSLSPEASEQTPYLRTLFVSGDVNDPCVEGCFRPLVTGKPGYANVAPGSAFGEEGRCPPVVKCGPEFYGATPDLSRIALESGPPLLSGSGKSEKYEWFEGGLSRGNRLPELRASTSEGGSWSYFVSGSVLAPGAASGSNNLYVSHGGVTRLVSVLSNEDSPDWTGSSSNTEGNDLDRRTSRVSPDGRWLAFMSQRELTGYDTHDAISGKPDEEVYLYHAPESLASEAGTLVCASCNPTGARPVGREVGELADYEHGLAIVAEHGPWGQEGHQWIAANIPGWTSYTNSSAIYQSRYLSDSGRLFFNSNDALVPQDVNGNEDVYEYEPQGAGNCTTASSLFSPRSGGCVGLVSSGQAAGESAFLDASGSGGDVFFLTSARLVSQDYDNALDVYDARECTGASSCFPAPAAVPPPCATGDACKPAPTPQPAIYGSPSSETFSGAGNVTPEAPAGPVKGKAKGSTGAQKLARALRSCRAKKGTRRRACERQARARFAQRSAGTAKRGRG